MFIHIVEYENRGTLWRLLNELNVYPNHKLLESKNHRVNINQLGIDNHFIIHTSGRSFPIIDSLEEFLQKGVICSVFVHNSPDYILEKGCCKFIKNLRRLQSRFNFKVLVPSNAVKEAFSDFGIICWVIRLGISPIVLREPIRNLKNLAGRIVTVNTNAQEKYVRAKGIDRFCEMIKHFGLEDSAAILGVDSISNDGIMRVKLTHEEMLWVLSKAKLYVQLSRSESYNITAIEARQLKVPLLLSNIGGHKSCNLNSMFLVDSHSNLYEKYNNLVNEDNYTLKSLLEDNYKWSLANENIESFKKSIEEICS